MLNFDEDQNAPLRDDVRMLGSLLGNTIKKQAGEEVYDTIEVIRKLAKALKKGDESAGAQLLTKLHNLPLNQLIPITKAFSQFLNFANIAEQYHRIRRARQYKMMPELGPQLGSLEDVISRLLARGVSKDDVYKAILALDIQLVLTSHPTEVKRRTLIIKYNHITSALAKLDRQILTPEEIENIKDSINQEMTAVWQTSELRSQKPTAVDEAKWGFAIIESSMWYAIPKFMRELRRTVRDFLGKELPINFAPLKVDSWLGGDRDGNPNVTPEVTRRVVFMARWVLADLLLREIVGLRQSLSMATCNDKLRSLVGDVREPYRALLKQVRLRLKATRGWARDNFVAQTPAHNPNYVNTEDLIEPLLICYESLHECNAGNIADGQLLDVIGQVMAFGLELVRTDIRQESSKHTELMTVITQLLDLGEYANWEEQERQKFLLTELAKPHNRLADEIYAALETKEAVQDLVQTFKLIAELPRASLGSYVISMSSQPSDVLAVVWLQRLFGMQHCLPVVPLFETRNDLENSAKILDNLLSHAVYRDLIQGYQQVMIGYSDSAKDVGMLAAAWAQYCAQEQMVAIAQQYKIKLVFFHGRGGSLGRGGWPTHSAILSQPPGSVHGVMRATQQGEVIQNRFGLRDIALRTFTVYATSTLEASLLPQPAPRPQWRELISELARVSAQEYKQIVAGDPNFIQYFQTATPTKELKRLAIGSRPDSRANADSLSKLRAIPWVFAWTQNRLLLPSWAGVGAALRYAFEHGRGKEVIEMREQWPFFQTLLSMSEMVLAKADVNVAAHYEQHLVPKELCAFGSGLREQFVADKQMLLEVLGTDKLLANNLVLDRSINFRNPYLLPLHLLQVELLYRVREQGENVRDEIIQALLITIVGIAAGMRNTG
jgi:phosphoenolpyruvate carboxylase